MTEALIEPAPAASEDLVTVTGQSIGLPGRFLISAGRNHIVSDARVSAGGPGEALQAGELLLGALASCGLALVHKHAGVLGVALSSSDVAVSFKRDPADPTRYEHIRLRFRLGGVDAATARELVGHFTGTCPIYNTLRRGGSIDAEVEVAAARR